MAIGESKKDVRTTWIGFTVIFAVIGSLLLYKGRDTYLYFYGASLFFGVFIFAPMVLLPIYRLWAKFAGAMAWFNTRLLLIIIYYLVLTPFGLVMRLFGKDPMDRKIDKTAATYWKRKIHHTDKKRYEKQY